MLCSYAEGKRIHKGEISMLVGYLNDAAQWLRPYSGQMSVALVATVLVIYGDTINKAVRVFVKPYPFVLRISAFVLLCTLGYGTLTVWGAAQVSGAMQKIPNVYFAPAIVMAFFILGFLAERYHKSK